MVDAVVAVAPYCTGVVSESVVSDGIVVGKVTIVLAATKGKAFVLVAVQAPTITST